MIRKGSICYCHLAEVGAEHVRKSGCFTAQTFSWHTLKHEVKILISNLNLVHEIRGKHKGNTGQI